MPYKDKDKQREFQQRWYQSNKERLGPRFKAARLRYKRRNKRFINRVKALGCMACGYKRCKTAIDFHHIHDKEFSISSGVNQWRRSIKRLKDELRKCVRVCANCHREIHAGILNVSEEDGRFKIEYPQ